MDNEAVMRMDRINRLLYELKYECERGFMEGEIDENIGFQYIVPVSRQITNGVVFIEFRTRPMHRDSVYAVSHNPEPRLKLVDTP